MCSAAAAPHLVARQHPHFDSGRAQVGKHLGHAVLGGGSGGGGGTGKAQQFGHTVLRRGGGGSAL
eukprot:2569580-Prymnesium_polylepis.1